MLLPSTRPGGRHVLRPLVTEGYLDLELVVEGGLLRPVSLREGRLPRPALLPRYRGPFELRIFAGRELLDVIGFSCALTLSGGGAQGGDATDAEHRLDRALASAVRARTTVRLPFVASVTAIEFYDSRNRSTQRWPITRLRRLPPGAAVRAAAARDGGAARRSAE
ncbi:MAG: hypothetical protein IPG96_15980 [Proteobacteria bacterium]|nr:hypothetical protein [Pseudomonadota bacterium]